MSCHQAILSKEIMKKLMISLTMSRLEATFEINSEEQIILSKKFLLNGHSVIYSERETKILIPSNSKPFKCKFFELADVKIVGDKITFIKYFGDENKEKELIWNMRFGREEKGGKDSVKYDTKSLPFQLFQNDCLSEYFRGTSTDF